MYARVKVVSYEDYRRWYDQTAADIERAQQEGARQRRELEQAEGEDAVQGGGGAGGASAPDQGN
jgi:heme/copper-type cytochrome/quinol oxidase subunit 2